MFIPCKSAHIFLYILKENNIHMMLFFDLFFVLSWYTSTDNIIVVWQSGLDNTISADPKSLELAEILFKGHRKPNSITISWQYRVGIYCWNAGLNQHNILYKTCDGAVKEETQRVLVVTWRIPRGTNEEDNTLKPHKTHV